jgi:hypothetical protein
MPGELLQPMETDPLLLAKVKTKPDLHLIVSGFWRFSIEIAMILTDIRDDQSDEDVIYEQDILRDGSGSIKPWLSYIDLKLQHGNIHEQAFV